ncbi:MAG TPA: Rrf2 family transcriptional regulator [Gammaproteobacteria bacterium]|nr:Rrf2 family transcriptional regulator [Gammaproteobacteria bacterium]
MNLHKATRFALYAILDLAEAPDRQVSGAEIAKRYDISTNHLAKVLRTLGRAGLVEAVRGAGGGYRFVGNARRTTLLDVIELFEDIRPISSGQRQPGDSTPAGQTLVKVLDEIEEIAHATFASITLETMLRLIEDTRRHQAAESAGSMSVPAGSGAV